MKIKAMTATFGRLDHARLELGPGLNIIHAPNEGGKSTWAAFWRVMLYGLNTREQNKKGFLADKNRFSPWSGAPMEGELVLEWQDQGFTIRRGPRGNVPFGSFSALRTGTGDPVPGLAADSCGEILTGAGRELFERSAFLSGGSLTVTSAPELERRIAALVSTGEEGTSFSQAEGRLREWLNRRRVNKSVGLIPKLEGELAQVDEALANLRAASDETARLEEARAALEAERDALAAEQAVHRRLAQRALNGRFVQADAAWQEAQKQLDGLEAETARFGVLPPKEELKAAQGQLQYIKVLEEEIRTHEAQLKSAREEAAAAQAAARDEHFPNVSGEEAVQRAAQEAAAVQADLDKLKKWGRATPALAALFLGLFALLAGVGYLSTHNLLLCLWLFGGWSAFVALVTVLNRFRAKKARGRVAAVLEPYGVDSPEALTALAQGFLARCQSAQEAQRRVQDLETALDQRREKREAARTGLLDFVHRFAPTVKDMFGCSAAISRSLSLDHELAQARTVAEERRRRRDDLAAQGGQALDTLEALRPPERSPAQTDQALAQAEERLNQLKDALNQALGRQTALGDPAALAARREELAGELARRQEEYAAISAALEALEEANARLQERFSPALNQLAGDYLARLTGARYAGLTLNRQLEGAALRPEDVLPRSVLSLSRGTADQLYLAVRLAICRLCLPDKPPILLDDALTTFDDQRLALALDLLRELAREQQILLFTCQKREAELLQGAPDVAFLEL